jgi:CubicO group peptidase (beta-lactamase class C family)
VGISGQMIAIDPARKVVVAMHSAWPVAGSPELREQRGAFVEALIEATD